MSTDNRGSENHRLVNLLRMGRAALNGASAQDGSYRVDEEVLTEKWLWARADETGRGCKKGAEEERDNSDELITRVSQSAP